LDCPKELNNFLYKKPIFENTFSEKECEKAKFYGDCYHCFSTSIAKRDKEIKIELIKEVIKAIQERESEPNYQHEDEDWKVGLIMAENAVNDFLIDLERPK